MTARQRALVIAAATAMSCAHVRPGHDVNDGQCANCKTVVRGALLALQRDALREILGLQVAEHIGDAARPA